MNPGQDAFLGRGINAIVIDPNNAKHIFVGSAQAVRGLSHVIGNGGHTRLEPGANAAGLYESTDGGKTFTRFGTETIRTFGVTDIGLDPLHPSIVYAAAFDQGAWRRDSGAAATAFNQVFAAQYPGGGVDRTMFALTGAERAYPDLPDRRHRQRWDATVQLLAHGQRRPAGGGAAGVAGCRLDRPAGNGNPFPATYNGWQVLTAPVTASPYYATDDFCTGQCWYDEDVYTPAGMPNTVYVIGSFQYGEVPCNTKGVGCGNGRSNGRAVLYSNTAGDPDSTAAGSGQPHVHRPDLRWSERACGLVWARRRRADVRRRHGVPVPLGSERDPSRPARDRHQPE